MQTGSNERNKKRCWNDEVKAMIGPCMITFAIPLTVPGVTITVVAFSKDKVFNLFGFWHILGMGFLVVSILMLLVGCIFRLIWKPYIGADLEMHLSPNPSLASMRNKVGDMAENTQSRARVIYSGSSDFSHSEHPVKSSQNKIKCAEQRNGNHSNKSVDDKGKYPKVAREKINASKCDKDKKSDATVERNTFDDIHPTKSSSKHSKRIYLDTGHPDYTSSDTAAKAESSAAIRDDNQISQPKTPRFLEPLNNSYSHDKDLYSIRKAALELNDIKKWRQRSSARKNKKTFEEHIDSSKVIEKNADSAKRKDSIGTIDDRNDVHINTDHFKKGSESEDSVALSQNENSDTPFPLIESQSKHQRHRKRKRRKKKKGMFSSSFSQIQKDTSCASLMVPSAEPLVEKCAGRSLGGSENEDEGVNENEMSDA